MNSFSSITKLKNAKTRLITAENVYGEKGKGGMANVSAVPQPEVEQIGQLWGVDPQGAAREQVLKEALPAAKRRGDKPSPPLQSIDPPYPSYHRSCRGSRRSAGAWYGCPPGSARSASLPG